MDEVFCSHHYRSQGNEHPFEEVGLQSASDDYEPRQLLHSGRGYWISDLKGELNDENNMA